MTPCALLLWTVGATIAALLLALGVFLGGREVWRSAQPATHEEIMRHIHDTEWKAKYLQHRERRE